MIGKIVTLKNRAKTSIQLPRTIAKTVYLGDEISATSKTVEDKFAEIDTIVSTILDRLQNLEESGGVIVPVDAVTLNTENLTLEIGKTFKLTATITPTEATNKLITWSSSNGNATVSNGTVTAVSIGTTVITATSHNGITATCSVDVVDVAPISRVTGGLVGLFDSYGVSKGTTAWINLSATHTGNATINNVDESSGFNGKTLSLDNVNDFVNIKPAIDNIDFTQDFTVIINLNLKEYASAGKILCIATGTGTLKDGLIIEKAGEVAVFNAWVNVLGSNKTIPAFVTNKSQIISIRKQGLNIILSNGTTKQSYTATDNMLSVTRGVANIASDGGSPNQTIKADIHSIYLYNRAITDEELKQNIDFENTLTRY